MFTTEIIQLNSHFPDNFKEIPKEFINNSTHFILNNYNPDPSGDYISNDDGENNLSFFFEILIFDGFPNETYDNLILNLTENESKQFIAGQKYDINYLLDDEQKLILNSNPNYKLFIAI